MKSGPRGAHCRCDCGAETDVQAGALTSGNTQSCGCYRVELATARLPAMSEANTVHGLSRARSQGKHPLYDTWRMMMARCYSTSHEYYGRYGGRGIVVCKRWHDPAVFISDIERLLGPRPNGCSLDRYPDNDGNYEEGNVRWATPVQQRHNTSAPGGPPPELAPHLIAEAKLRRQEGTVLRVLAEDYGVSIPTMHRYVTGVRGTGQPVLAGLARRGARDG